MNGYQLTRQWFEWRFNNPGKLSSAHAELYFYIVDRWNYFGQKPEFGLPRLHTMEVLSIGSRNTYKKLFGDLIEHGFIKLIRESCNQYHHASIIALSKFEQAPDTPLDTPTEQAHEQAPDPIGKPNNLGTKELKKKGFDFSGYGMLSELMQKWVDYKKSIKNSYKSQSSLDIVFKKLNELSGGDYQKAEAIVEQSIANQWQGLFELRQHNTNVNRGNSQPPVDPSKIINYGKGNGAVVYSEKYKVYYEPIHNGQPPKEVVDLIYLDQGNHSNYGEYVKWMLKNDRHPLPPEDTRYFPEDWNFEKFVSEQKAILANSNQ
jgi:hypothetical protein